MEDPNLIACLSPEKPEYEDIYTWEAIRKNTSGYIPPPVSGYRSRESTAPLEDEQSQTSSTSYPNLHLAFNSGLKSGHGLMFGTDSNSCNVVLPRLKRISQHHCYLTFDAERRLILRDCSTNGTIVKYDEQGRELRRHFTWILGGHEVPQRTKNIVMEIQGVSFQIKVSRHDTHPDLYNANVDRFLKEADEPSLKGLGIFSPTAPPSQSGTPKQRPIRLKQETLGKGAFAVVRRFWDVSTGIKYAYKEPINKREFDRELWEKEAEIMGQISHDHVVRLEEFVFTPSPRLVLEYVPCGTLDGLDLSLEQSMTVLCQGLSALVDLHGRKTPIVHRDIKPGNILLQSRDPLYIKFTDFGLSRASNDLKTFCGTKMYLAPEVYQRRKYTPAVDIWSFGLVIYGCAYGGLPSMKQYREKDWCKRLVDEVNDWENGDLTDLLSRDMIVMDPKLRGPARDCYKEALRFIVASQERCLTPTPASFVENYEESISSGCLAADVNFQTSQYKDSTRRTRSDAPPPHPSVSTRKRSTLPSTSSSSKRLNKRYGNSQHAESERVSNLFGEGWLQDPNCVGSSVAAMGQESSNWNSWGNSTTGSSEVYVQRIVQADHPYQVGDASAQAAYCNTAARGEGEDGPLNSEEYMAARLLHEMREGGYL